MLDRILSFKIDNLFEKDRKTKKKEQNVKNKIKTKTISSKNNHKSKKYDSKDFKNNCDSKKVAVIDPICFDWTKPFKEFTQETQNALKVVSLWNHNPKNFPRVVGSAGSKMFKFPGDIDAMQDIVVDATSFNNLWEAKDFLEDAFMNLFHRVMSIGPTCVFIDFKAGLDSRYVVPFYLNINDKSPNKKLYSKLEFIKFINKVKQKEYITKNFYNYIINTLPNNLDKLGKKKVKHIFEIFRHLATIRWDIYTIRTPKDPEMSWPDNVHIRKEFKVDFEVVPEKSIISHRLADCLFQGTRVKLDVYYYIDQDWKELTNVYIIKLKNIDPAGKRILPKNKGGTEKQITESFDKYREDLLKDIKFYHAKGNYLKVAKRLWNLSRDSFKKYQIKKKKNNRDMIRFHAVKRSLNFTKIYNTNIAELSQINSDIEVLSEMMQHITKEVLYEEETEKRTLGFVKLNQNSIKPKFRKTWPKVSNPDNDWFRRTNVETIFEPNRTLSCVWATLINQLMVKYNQLEEIIASTGLNTTDFDNVRKVYDNFMGTKCLSNKWVCGKNFKGIQLKEKEKNTYLTWIHNDIQNGWSSYKRPFTGSMEDNVRHYMNNMGLDITANHLPPWVTNKFWKDYGKTVSKIHEELNISINKISMKIIEKLTNIQDIDKEIEYLYKNL